ncbi:MAG: DUF2846 domain-containing protein [Alphaproteobacteria bacterium]|nr:DUF2846 domain-containing protein [Alphaproteobacteria bacterium]
MARIARFKLGAYTRRILKTGVLLVLALALGSALALGGLDTATVPMAMKRDDTAAKTFTPAPGRANIYVYREMDGVFEQMFPLMVDGQFVGGLAAKTYHVIEAAPGLHVITVLAPSSQRNTQLIVEAGKNYFVSLIGEELGSYWSRVDVWQVTDEEGTAGVLEAKRAEGMPAPFFAPVDSGPAPEILTQLGEILTDPNIKTVIKRYYNSQKVWRKLRIGKLKQGRTTMRSISDLRFAGISRDYLKIQVKYEWYFGGPSNIDYPGYIVITMKKTGKDYEILGYDLGVWKY